MTDPTAAEAEDVALLLVAAKWDNRARAEGDPEWERLAEKLRRIVWVRDQRRRQAVPRDT